jgi:hypothetical protein
LLVMVSWPVAAPTTVGSNCTLTVVPCPGFSVTGKVAPEIWKPEPVTAAALIVTGAVPVEVRVTGCGVAAVFTKTLPKATLVALMLRVGIAALSCRAKTLDTLPALAVIVTAWTVATEDTVAVNPALLAPAGTVTVLGTVTAELLLDRLTSSPPLGAAAVSVTVQASVPDPVIDPLLQESALSAAGVAVPLPVRPITAVALIDELLVMVN